MRFNLLGDFPGRDIGIIYAQAPLVRHFRKQIVFVDNSVELRLGPDLGEFCPGRMLYPFG